MQNGTDLAEDSDNCRSVEVDDGGNAQQGVIEETVRLLSLVTGMWLDTYYREMSRGVAQKMFDRQLG